MKSEESSIDEPSNSNSVNGTKVTEEDKKWYGVPPKGEQHLPSNYLFLLFLVIFLEIAIWAIYRSLSAPLFEGFGDLEFYLFHIIAAPTIHLIPILIFWRHIRKERGLPFRFTKKLLLSGVIVGLCGAIIWRLIEQFSWDGLAGMAGGTVPGTFAFFNVMDPVLLFSIMTFVQFFSVGPVEELEFRSFALDQASRVLPNWKALIFSSVLFGCSHIPIALFVYQFPPHIFVAALFGWISAGVVFGVLYIFTRNIFACIVMHGMGNWQLSVFYFQSTEAAMEPAAYFFVSIMTTIIADGVMIFIFYLIHRFYWQPHRRGESALGGRFQSLQNFIHEHDFERKPFQITSMILIAFVVLVCGTIMSTSYLAGVTEAPTPSQESGGIGTSYLRSLSQSEETITESNSLTEGSSIQILLNIESNTYIKAINVTVTWTDEEDVQRLQTYENQPDTLSVTVSGPSASSDTTGANPQGGEGRITTGISYTLEEISEILSTDEDNYQFLVEITLVEAGDSQPPFGPLSIADNGNQFSYEIQILKLGPE
jgi:membrane protease YdiL (CAAX protease family)